MCDRILVLYEGLPVALLRASEATAETVMAYANGGSHL
jgi:ABC-type sugar transport system ATPase subunit